MALSRTHPELFSDDASGVSNFLIKRQTVKDAVKSYPLIFRNNRSTEVSLV